MEVKKLDKPTQIQDYETVRCKEMGNITEIMRSQRISKGGYTVKLNKDEYLDTRTGEIREFKHIENRAQDLANVSKTLSRGRDLLNTNITDVSKCRWITFTYAENMTDPERLKVDFRKCVRTLRKQFGHFEYITAAEPQGRGAWHLHAVFIFENKAPFMKNEIVAEAWKQGFVTVKKLDDVDNVGAYLTAYLGDMDLSEVKEDKEIPSFLKGNKGIKEVEVTDENGKKMTKKYVKGARLYMYPPGFHIFRWSTGIKQPTVSNIAYSEAKEKVRSAKQTFTKVVELKDEVNGFENVLQYEYYNSIRK